MPNFCMTLSYDGTRYNGWQRQGNTPDTIQGRLETALSALLEQPVEVAGSGRTDAGVHARMQTASFRAKTDLPAPELLRHLNAIGGRITVSSDAHSAAAICCAFDKAEALAQSCGFTELWQFNGNRFEAVTI